MRKISKLAGAGLGLILLTGGAAAAQEMRTVKLAVPEGSVVQVRYTGDQAPQVSVVPMQRVAVPVVMADPIAARFAEFDRVFDEMDRQMAAMMQQAQMLARQPAAAGVRPDTASLARMPAGGTVRYTYVSTSSGNGTGCTQSVQMISYGAGAEPKVVSQSSGDCSAVGNPVIKASAPPVPAAKPAPRKTVDRNTV
ncbi:MAG: hypothetical protein J7500_10140 [Sphingomonas sp.]|uniref:hypothetical protein n=1 Tax=Sphingomonas sp. TaxID=28214 RepID=UPI001B02E90D|nr:hypothetical protein [Sphingomonas sp.]MBO9623057.1 hypothetical protein [Sphingomonas sp.]